MALNYLQQDALTTNPNFLGRVRRALWLIAIYHRPGTNPGTNQAKQNWAIQVIDNRRVAVIAETLAGEAVADGSVISAAQADASDVPDDSIKAAVEAICFKYT